MEDHTKTTEDLKSKTLQELRQMDRTPADQKEINRKSVTSLLGGMGINAQFKGDK
jgi:hypothetical protein